MITSKDLKKCGYTWVCPISDHVCTRFLFVWVNVLPPLTETLRPPTVTARPNTHQLFVFPPQLRKRADRRLVGQHAGHGDQPRNFAGHCITAWLTLRPRMSPLRLCFCTRLTFCLYWTFCFCILLCFVSWTTKFLDFLRKSYQTCDDRFDLSGLLQCCLTAHLAHFSWAYFSFFVFLACSVLFTATTKHFAHFFKS